MSKSVLVTGGAGYIGSHACKLLAQKGYLPVAYDNLSRGHADLVKWGPLEQGDVNDVARLGDVCARHKPVAVMHFAAFAYVGESVGDPLRYYRNNVGGTLTLLETMIKCGIRDMVFSSSCAVYGTPSHVPVDETHPCSPLSPYGRTKLMCEQMLEDAGAAHGIRHIALRYFNAAGCDPDGATGERHDPETHLIPLALAAAAGNGPSLTLFGETYPTPDGTCIRDYIHVADLAQAHVCALRAIEKGVTGAFNLGTGHGYSVRQVITAVERVTGKKVPFVIAPARAGDATALFADAGKARAELGWVPEYGDLDGIIRTAWEWYRQDLR